MSGGPGWIGQNAVELGWPIRVGAEDFATVSALVASHVATELPPRPTQWTHMACMLELVNDGAIC